MSCINHYTKISIEISETLGPKFQNAQNFNLKLVGGALKEAIQSYGIFGLKILVPSAETSYKGRSYEISRNPTRVILFCRREKMVENCLCNGFFKTYALIPC